MSALLSWSHNTLLFDKTKILDEYLWYAGQTIKNGWSLSSLECIIEREIENELVANIAKTIMELGTGFAFVGNQYHIEVSEKDYCIDLLFYNTKLRCYVAIELKNTEFKPEYALKDINKPIGVSEYKLSDFVPAELIDTLPSAEDTEKRVKLKYDIDDKDE